MITLSHRRALITGASRGIGAATARLLAQAGAHVALGYRSRGVEAAAVAAECAAFGVKASAHAADLSTRAGCDALFDQALGALGGLDLFVGNAGIWPADEVPVAALDDERWARTMRENVDAMFWTARRAAQALAPGGRLVLVGSTAGQRGEAMHADYAAAKGELAPRDITVNCVAPGWVDTEMTADAMAGGGRARIAATIPIGRVATPADVAGPILFLCSPLARHVTGEILNVNGGSVLCG
ncbi:MAG: SDR family oxidoreductase [Gemmatimonadaceae bacterium]|nr:SDR family oxidoreductase [Gemmatimonadaceae bacterium]